MTTAEVFDSRTRSVVDRWLAERSEMFVLYCRLTGSRNSNILPDAAQVAQFCDILIDYVSAGHFEVYEQLVSLCDQHGPNSIQLLKELFPKINSTTDIVVNFNDKYCDDGAYEKVHAELDVDLSKLGVAIAERAELEDQLINTLSEFH